jgi:hypothetical protein
MGPALAQQTTVSGKLGLLERGCSLGCTEACDGAGTLLRTAPNDLRDDERALAYYERACRADNARGCLHMGELRERAHPNEPDGGGAKQAYERARDLRDGDGSAALGELLEAHGSDRQAVIAEYMRGCELDSGRACAKLAAVYELGDGVPLDTTRAFGLYEQACERKAAAGCRGAARLLASKSDEASVSRFERRAAELDTEACNDGEPVSCTLLGDAYRDGRGVDKDVKRAARLYALGCEEGVELACEGLKRLPAPEP